MTYSEAYLFIKKQFADAGIEAAAFEALQLLEYVTEYNRTKLLLQGETPIADKKYEILRELADRRTAGYPLQYLIGSWEFYGLSFTIGEGVLIPRADTELLVDTALQLLDSVESSNPKIVDLCSGSGCVAISIAHHKPNTVVTALEKSEQAFAYLQRNIADNAVSVDAKLADVLMPSSILDAGLQMVVSNPPYIRTEVLSELSREVQFEPRMALDGSEDGLFFYREITRLWSRAISPGGYLVYEIGYDQGEAVSAILSQYGYQAITVRKDLSGNDRVVFGQRR